MNKQTGQVLIISLIFMLVILVLVSALFGLVLQNVSATRKAYVREQALQLADAGIDKAIWSLNQTAGTYTGETNVVLSVGAFDVSVASISATAKEITATGYAPDKANPRATKTVKVRVNIDTTNVSFNYGVQVGEGGLLMENNSTVTGNVYSNGVVEGNAGAIIGGDVFSAEATGRIFNRLTVQGNAYAHTLNQNITVNGNAYGQVMDSITVNNDVFANTISNCTIGGAAFYTAKTSCSISGAETTPYPGEPDPPPEDFPITDEQIDDWKVAAENGGTIVGDFILINGETETLGPKKIIGKLILSNNSVLTLQGPLWVVGEISISNNAVTALDPAYGDGSEVIVSDYKIDVSNNAIFQGAGPDSYILMITTSTLPNDAFKVANNADTLIAFAPYGGVEVSNNAILREVTGWKIILKNNSEVIYETGLANLNFTGGPGASWAVERGTWREVK